MQLTAEQQALLDGAKGEVMAKVVKTLVMYGETFGAERMVPVTSKYGHTVISFGLKVMAPVYDMYDRLISAGLTAGQKFTADPRPLDKNVPSSFLENIVFNKIMYTQQQRYEEQLRKLEDVRDIKELKPGHSVYRELIMVKVRANASQRQAISAISDIFRATIVDVGKESLTVMLTGDQSKLDALINLLEDYEILELARTGLTGLSRGADDVRYLP